MDNETKYLNKYISLKTTHRNLLFKFEAMQNKYEKEIQRLKEIISNPINRNAEHHDLEVILKSVSSVTGIIPQDILGRNRQRNISVARHLFCYLAYNQNGFTLTSIGRFLVKDHSTVLNSIRKYENYIDCKYKEEIQLYEQCKRILSTCVE